MAEPSPLGDAPRVCAFNVKSPSLGSREESLPVQLSLDNSVAEVKQRLQAEYPGNPDPARQTLIYAGKVLKDESLRLRDVVKQEYDANVPYTLHLVVKAPQSQSQPQPEQQPKASSSTAAAPSNGDAVPRTPEQSEDGAGPSAAAAAPEQPAGDQSWAAFGGPFDQTAPMAAGVPPDALQQGYAYAVAYPSPCLIAHPAMSAMYNAAYAAFHCASSAPGAADGGAPAASALPAVAYMPLMIPPPQPTLVFPVPQPLQQPGGQQAQGGQQPFMAAGPQPMIQLAQYYPMPIPGHPNYMQSLVQLMQAYHAAMGGAPRGAAVNGVPAGVVPRPPQMARRGGRPVVRVRMLRINVRQLLQLVAVGAFVYQCPPQQRLILVAGGILLWLTTLAPLRRLLHQLVGLHARPAAAEGGQPQQPGLLRELQALVMGFLTSLLPGWNYNPEDAAAFAAAQDVVAREAQAGFGQQGGAAQQPLAQQEQPAPAAGGAAAAQPAAQAAAGVGEHAHQE